jgi:5-methylcytosine-specific restriction endonuclease McrBC regulatory subunit McrC
VKPKVDGADLFKLLSLAGDPRSYFVHRGAELTATRESSLVELFVDAYLTAIKNLLGTSGLRGLHQEHERKLVLRAKGRIRVPQYLREFAAGRPQLIPCSFSAHAVDNVVNRILRWALHVLLSSASTSSSRLSQLDRLDASFAGIALQRMTVSDLNRVARLPESFSTYFVSGALPIAAFIIRNLNLGALPGDLEASSVTFPAHEVFERAFANEAARRCAEHVDAIAQVEWPIQALKPTGEQKIGTFKPDLVLLPKDGRAGLVADTKWKTCIQEGVATGLSPELEAGIDLPGIRLHNADLFQILAYIEAAKRLHSDDRFVGVLVYPVANVREEDLEPMEIKTGIAQNGKTLSVFVLPWDVGTECSARTDVLWRHLSTLRNMPLRRIL